jgi:hypothetical protein
MSFPDWGDGNEPSITVVMKMILTGPFYAEETILADCGLHALARRIERARPNDESAALTDLKALADGFRSALAKGGNFEIRARSGGKWLGSVTAVSNPAVFVLD